MKKLTALLRMSKSRIAGFALTLLLLSSTCFAINFSQPQELGHFGFMQAGRGAGGINFENASYIDGDYFLKYNKSNKFSYGKGVARYGDGDDALFIHFNVYQYNRDVLVGGKDANNSCIVDSITQKISRIRSDEGVTLYPMLMFYGPERYYTIVGRQKDGKFVKFIDTRAISKKYFGIGRHGGPAVVYTKMAVVGDSIILYYGKTFVEPLGEFRFKWDERAQWFGIEQVVY